MIIFVIVLFLLFYVFSERPTLHKKQYVPDNFGIDMHNICKLANAAGCNRVNASKSSAPIIAINNYSNHDERDTDTKYTERLASEADCEKAARSNCPIVNDTYSQLQHHKELNAALILEKTDTSAPMRYTDTDRYIVDNKYLTGDERLALKMQDTGRRAKQSLDARASWSKNSLLPYLEAELQDSANAFGWWEDDALEANF